MNKRQPIRLATALAGAGALAGVASWAAPIHVNPYAEYSLSVDDNLYRLPDGETATFTDAENRRSDTIQRRTIGVLVDWPVSRQNVEIAAHASDYDYDHFGELDHSESGVRTALRYNFGSAVSGTTSYENNRELVDFANSDNNRADFLRREEFEVDNRVAVTPRWRVRTRYGHLRLSHSLDSERRFDRREDQALVALEYTGSGNSVLGVGAEHIDGEFPHRDADDVFAQSFDQNEIFTSVTWDYSAQSSLYGRIGYTQRDNAGHDDRDFSGVTGRLRYDRELTGKTSLGAEFSRQIYSVDEIDANYLRETAARLDLNWRYSPKVEGTAGLARRWQKYATVQGDDDASRRDKVDEVSAELSYRPLHPITLSLGARYEWRDSNEAGEDYDALIGTATIRIALDDD